jgi:hypothetical protein
MNMIGSNQTAETSVIGDPLAQLTSIGVLQMLLSMVGSYILYIIYILIRIHRCYNFMETVYHNLIKFFTDR